MGDKHYPDGILLGRARVPGLDQPRIVTVRDGDVVDITAKGMATVRDIAESGSAAEHVRNAS
ncbi:MAG: fumarylacetoacetate hydrolase, partial [Devosia sp.]